MSNFLHMLAERVNGEIAQLLNVGPEGQPAVLTAQAAARTCMRTRGIYAAEGIEGKTGSGLQLLQQAMEVRPYIDNEPDDVVRAAQSFNQVADMMAALINHQAALKQTPEVRNGVNALQVLSARAMAASAQQARAGGMHEAATKFEAEIPAMTMGIDSELIQLPNDALVGEIADSFLHLFDHVPELDSRMSKEVDNRLVTLFEQSLKQKVSKEQGQGSRHTDSGPESEAADSSFTQRVQKEGRGPASHRPAQVGSPYVSSSR